MELFQISVIWSLRILSCILWLYLFPWHNKSEFGILNNSLSFVPGEPYLPRGLYADYTNVHSFKDQYFTCPTIRMSSSNIAVQLNHSYHGWELCQCENGYRRKQSVFPSVNMSLPILEVSIVWLWYLVLIFFPSLFLRVLNVLLVWDAITEATILNLHWNVCKF